MPETGPIKEHNVEGRGIPELPLILVLTEEFGGVFFLQLDGKVDYTGFLGTDQTFLSWVRDLFDYYWELATQKENND